MVLYDGASIREIDKNFRDAVDEYLQFCESRGKTPDVPFKGSFNVRISQDLHQRAALYAEEHEVKLNAVVQEALKEYLTHAE
jgi:predicted HicB family RNase H-like nuclease